MNTHVGSSISNKDRCPPFHPLPIATLIAALFTGPALAADYNFPLLFTNSSPLVASLVQKQVDVSSPAPAVALQHVDFSLRDVVLRNSVGGGVDVLSGARLLAQGVDAVTSGTALQVNSQSLADLSGPSALYTTGAKSPAASVTNAELRLHDVSLQTTGILSPGIDVGANALLQVERSQIVTFDMSSAGIREQGNLLANVVRDSQIHTHQAESAGVQVSASAGQLSLINTQIITDAAASDGVSARQDSNVTLSRASSVHTLGASASGVRADLGANIDVVDSALLTEGTGAFGATANRLSNINLVRSQVLTTGAQAAALAIHGEAHISASDSAVSSVDASTVVFSAFSPLGSTGTLTLLRTRLSGPSALIEAQPGSHGVASITDSQWVAPTATAFLAAAGSSLKADLESSQVSVADFAQTNGDGQLAITTVASQVTGDTRLLSPASGRLDLDLHNSSWVFSGNSSASNLNLSDSKVMFGGHGFQVLTLNGDLSGTGRFQMKSDLASSQGDLLSVTGQVSGQHELLVADSGHAATGQPLKLVGSGGGAGQFTLYGGHVDAGAFRYALTRQGNDWYLAQTGQVAPMQTLVPPLQKPAIPTPLASNVAMTPLNPAMKPQAIPQPITSNVAMTPLNPAMKPQAIPQPITSNVAMTPLNPAMKPQAIPQPITSNVVMTPLNPAMKPQAIPQPITSNVAMTPLNPAMKPQAIPKPVVSNVAMTTLTPAQPPQPRVSRALPTQLPQAQRLSKGANAALGMQTAAANLWQNEMGTLSRRLGELRLGKDQGGLWTRAMDARLNVDSGDSRAFDQRLSGIEVGADRAIEFNDATLYLGGMLGIGHADQDFAEHSSGDIDSRSVGLYATYLQDNGVYLDTVLKYDHLKGDVKVSQNLGDQVSGHYDANAYGASVELGRQIALADGWFIEPQAQLSAAHLQGPRYTSSDSLEVKAQDQDTVQARVGARAGRNFMLASGTQVQGYLSVSQIEELAGDSHVSVDGHTLDNSLPGTRTDYGAGTALQLSARQKLMVETHYVHGSEIEQPLQVTVGYRILW
ncbi:autotransporter outer membrane beta-barrel domain-containing protein [Pseudomonas sp. V1]|uniref:autotransporter outer membrane beta-barrel domain-containing protein n=1 Tax=Pseudomonas arcuscaelestis TaxID=2710591 RepID=UPI00193EEDEC|nr:autotransporter outer membrane beta-barrel domain-containing protein [Pseudomonas arcuscaelestis]MBM3103969.1 autotransporter outer membrane beta-barrel domain-containing protein [Pseudomonas arcuscaelestis]